MFVLRGRSGVVVSLFLTRDKSQRSLRLSSLWVHKSPVVKLATKLGNERVRFILNLFVP